MEQRSLRSLRRSKFGRAEYTGIATISELKALPKLPNLVNPFWMLPLLGILKLEGPGQLGSRANRSWIVRQTLPYRIMEELLEAGHPPDIWIQDLTRGSFSRLTRGPASNFNPIWAPDGKHLLYTSGDTGSCASTSPPPE